MSYSRSSSNADLSPGKAIALIVLAVTALIALIFGIATGFAAIGAFDSIDGGHIAVLRNGGLANQNIRGFLTPGSGMTWTGLYSTEHIYPAQQQVYTIDADPKQGQTQTADSISVPSSDGVEIQIEGTLYYSLDLDQAVLGEFDNRYGTQTYSWDGKTLHPYDGADGWNAFINSVVRPTLQNELRTAMAQVSCEDVDPACSLVRNATNTQAATSTGASSNGNLGKIQDAINAELQSDLASQLGSVPVVVNSKKQELTFLQNLRFTISTVTLPANVQSAINDAQAAFAQVSSAQAKVTAAQANAKANEITQQGYAACPACAIIAEEQAIPSTITTYAPGAGAALAIGSH